MDVDPEILRDRALFLDRLPGYLLAEQAAVRLVDGIQVWGTPDPFSIATSWWGAPLSQRVLLSGDPADGSGRLSISTNSVRGIDDVVRARQLVMGFAEQTTVALPLVSEAGVLSWHSAVAVDPGGLGRTFGKVRQVLRLQYQQVERTTSMFSVLLDGQPAVSTPAEDCMLYLSFADAWGEVVDPSWEWTAADLASVREVVRARGGEVLRATPEGVIGGLLHVGPVGASDGDEMAEFVFIADAVHENAGPSITAVLTLPVYLGPAALYALNEAEIAEPAGSVLGAWCKSPVSEKACFLTFAPERLSAHLSFSELADLVASRASWVGSVIRRQ